MEITMLNKEFSYTASQKEITDLTGIINEVESKIGFIDYCCGKFGIDRSFYQDWLNSTYDFAELVVLYLSTDVKEMIKQECLKIKLMFVPEFSSMVH
jgi:hypothetical protein